MDYWEYPGAGGDETFGFFNVGLSLGIPRSAVPEEDGSWEVAAGIQHVTRGDGLTAINGTDDDLNLLTGHDPREQALTSGARSVW